jgi:glutaconate CoA-transferase subunit B
VSALGDLFTTVLAREFAAAATDDGVRVIAVTTTASLVAALAARRLGTPDLAIAPGFGTLDAAPQPALSLGERAMRAGASPRGPASDTFVAVARGLIGVVVTPAQLDRRGATNLSHIAGAHDAPRVALPGSRGLPDNNDSPSRVWYLVADHAARTLVDRVDFVSGPPPSPQRIRRLITRLGVFALDAHHGWKTDYLFPDVGAADVATAGGFPIRVAPDVPTVAHPTPAELEALAAVDPDDLRSIEFDGADGARRALRIVAGERQGL